MSQTIGQRIKQQRLAKKLTQAQVAEQLFVTQQTVARWENGQHLPPVTALQDLAKLLEVDIAYFFGETVVTKTHFNLMALFGNLIFNGGFLIMITIAFVPMLISIWGVTLASVLTPFVVFWQAYHDQLFTWWRLLASLAMSFTAIVVSPLLWKLTQYLGRILRAYYRYCWTTIRYQVVVQPKSEDQTHD